ncbi:hypothetical protein ES708_22910 [subsurface metagenome]
MEELMNGIFQIGNQLVNCNHNCAGIRNSPQEGIIPRCLYLEHQDRQGEKGCVIVGINPGRSTNNNRERNFYLDNHLSYNTIVNFWTNHGGYNHTYYRYLRDFVNCIGFDGSILWTELVKCENDNETNFPPLQTFRICTHNYLTNELNLVPDNWPLISAGKEVYKALSFLYPTKSILGVPHPNSRGNFPRLFTDNNRNQFKGNIQNQIDNFKSNIGIAVWLNT